MTTLQRDLLIAFFAREDRLFLTGGGALAGFYFGHRDTEDLDLFGLPGVDLAEAARALAEAALACGATLAAGSTYTDFRRLIASRGEEHCKVDLVVDRAPVVDRDKSMFDTVRVDTLREIAANKVCTLLSRSEIRDLVDLKEILDAGVDLEQAFSDACRKDSGADPATLAWVLDQISIGPEAALPGGQDPAALLRFRDAFSRRLRELAFSIAQRDRG